jgi:hypothetical protein
MSMEILNTIKKRLQKMDVKYSSGKKSRCHWYNLCDIFDSVDN